MNVPISYFRTQGFPIHSLTIDERRKELLNLLRYDRTGMVKSGVVKQTMHCQNLCWHYQPHSWKVRCGDMRTPLDVFGDDALLQDALERRKRMGKCKTESDFRKAFSMYSGTQTVSNFRATAYAALCDRYLPPSGGVLYDPCGGWGGRLLGSLACKKVKRYIACEPSSLTYSGLCAMRDELRPMMKRLGYRAPEIDLHPCGAEDFPLEAGSISMAATSFPYFDREKYSNEESQSYVRFPTPDRWLNGFLGATLSHCYHALDTGILAVNLASVSSYPDMTEHFFWLAGRCGFRPVETLRLTLSANPGMRNGAAFKYEPIFIFRKG